MRRNRKENSKKRRGTFSELLGKQFEIDADLIGSGCRVEIRGHNRVEVSGVKRIGSYTETEVVLILDGDVLTVCGERLECVCYRRGAAAVEGKIRSVSFGE